MAFGIAALVGGCAPLDAPRAALCQRALAAIEAPRQPVVVPVPPGETTTSGSVVLRYRLEDARERRIVCRFAAPGRGTDPLELTGVRTDAWGELSPIALFFLRTYVLDRPPLLPEPEPEQAAAVGTAAYLLQQLANALTPAAIYALLATGYALIYGITGRINLAFGDFTMAGAFAALNGMVLGAMALATSLPAGAPWGLVQAAASGAALGLILHALVFRPLHGRSSQALLIATIGLGIALSEALRLLTQARQSWLPPMLDQPLTLLQVQGGEVALSLGQVLLAGLSFLIVLGVMLLLRRSAFGRRYRACADDPGAAALVGVNVDRTLRDVCMLGGAIAGLAGFVVAMRYGVVAFWMGSWWGFKALAAAIIGGIGSVPGAALGGVLIGLLEGLWAAYLPAGHRDVALFVFLALVLALRPHGLFGTIIAADNPALWRERPFT